MVGEWDQKGLLVRFVEDRQRTGTPMSMGDLKRAIDTDSEERVRQLLKQLRRGEMSRGRKEPGKKYPAIPVHWDRRTGMYIFMDSENVARELSPTIDVLKELTQGLASRADSITEIARSLLSALPGLDMMSTRVLLLELEQRKQEVETVRELPDTFDELLREVRKKAQHRGSRQ